MAKFFASPFTFAVAVALSLATFFAQVPAQAETLTLGRGTVFAEDEISYIELGRREQVQAINVQVTGGALRIWELTVSYEAPTITRKKFNLGGVYGSGAGTGWLQIPQNGYPVRRILIKGEPLGSGQAARVVVFGSR